MLTFDASRRPFDRRFGDGPRSVRTISSRHNPVVAAFRALAATPDPTGRRVLLDGAHLVGEALDAGLGFEVILVAASRLGGATEAARLARELQQRGLPMAEVDDRAFDAVSPVRSPSGIVAIALRTVQAPGDLCARPDALVVAVADVQDPGNVGALLRSAEAGGATGAFVTGASANPFSWKALRGSMGSALRLPTVTGAAPDAILASMRQAGMRTVAAVARGGVEPDAIDWRGAVGLWIGGEGPGLPAELVERCDVRATIPMAPEVESLNAAVAGALLVYAARRQRSEAEPRS